MYTKNVILKAIFLYVRLFHDIAIIKKECFEPEVFRGRGKKLIKVFVTDRSGDSERREELSRRSEHTFRKYFKAFETLAITIISAPKR